MVPRRRKEEKSQKKEVQSNQTQKEHHPRLRPGPSCWPFPRKESRVLEAARIRPPPCYRPPQGERRANQTRQLGLYPDHQRESRP